MRTVKGIGEREPASAPAPVDSAVSSRRIDGAHVDQAAETGAKSPDSPALESDAQPTEKKTSLTRRFWKRVTGPRMISILAAGLTAILRTKAATIRMRIEASSPEIDPRLAENGCIYPIWHEGVLLTALKFSGNPNDINILVSESRDGNYIAEVLRRLKLQTVRGSSTRGGVKALREMLRSIKTGHLVLMPDGPRGPARSFQSGALFLASRTGAPIVPVGLAFSRVWRLNSWDRFIIPKPFSRAVMYLGDPVHIPKGCSAEELEEFQPTVCEAMDRAEAKAHELLTTKAKRA